MIRKIAIGLLLITLLITLLAGCGGKDKQDQKNNNTPGQSETTPTRAPQPTATMRRPTITPHAPAPRSLPTPEGDPYAFEAPFSAGNFVRQTMRGNAVSARLGGMQATYKRDQDAVALTIYHFEQPQQAIDTVRFVLEGSSVTHIIETPYYGPTVAYGVVQVRSGAIMAAWSHYGWAFIAQGTGSTTVISDFLQVFPF
jgi:hypothetical protein